MYSKQMMHSIPGVYKIYAHIPYGYFAPQGWTIESGFASKTVVLPKDNIEIINVNLEFFKK
jgi:hypothetical protein